MEGQNYLFLQTFSIPFHRFTELFSHMYKQVETSENEMHPSCPIMTTGWILQEDPEACCCCQTQQWFRNNTCACGEVESRLANKYSSTRKTSASKESHCTGSELHHRDSFKSFRFHPKLSEHCINQEPFLITEEYRSRPLAWLLGNGCSCDDILKKLWKPSHRCRDEAFIACILIIFVYTA